MTPEQYQNEMTYQLTLLQAQHIRKLNLLSVEEFQAFQQLMIEKYQPIISQ